MKDIHRLPLIIFIGVLKFLCLRKALTNFQTNDQGHQNFIKSTTHQNNIPEAINKHIRLNKFTELHVGRLALKCHLYVDVSILKISRPIHYV